MADNGPVRWEKTLDRLFTKAVMTLMSTTRDVGVGNSKHVFQVRLVIKARPASSSANPRPNHRAFKNLYVKGSNFGNFTFARSAYPPSGYLVVTVVLVCLSRSRNVMGRHLNSVLTLTYNFHYVNENKWNLYSHRAYVRTRRNLWGQSRWEAECDGSFKIICLFDCSRPSRKDLILTK